VFTAKNVNIVYINPCKDEENGKRQLEKALSPRQPGGITA
jgi:hypothetical protein